MIISIIYLFIEILSLRSVLQVKHSDRHSSFVSWLPACIVFVMAFHAVWSGLLSLLGIELSLLSIGCGNLLLIQLCHFTVRNYGKQEYVYGESDLCVLMLVFVAVILFGLIMFGPAFEIHFWSVDASAHCRMAQSVAIDHKISNNLFFSAINNGIAMLVLEPFVGVQYFYKVYIVMELFDFWLATTMFYGLLLLIKPKSNILIRIVFTFCYAVGYPMYAIIFGFSYFGASITIVTACMFLMEANASETLKKTFFIIALNVLLFSLFVCYTYFVPIICATVFVYLFNVYLLNEGRISITKLISEECKVFVFPVILGLIFSASNISELGAGGGITNEGGCYYDLYSNFVLLLFFSVYGFFSSRGFKQMLSIRIMTVFSLAFFAALFVMFSHGKASTYYLSKIYNLFWLEYFLLSYYAVITLKCNRSTIKKGILTGLTLSFFSCIAENMTVRAEEKITLKGTIRFLVPEIYGFNILGLCQDYVTDDYMQSLWILKNNYEVSSDSVIAIGDEVKCGWFKTVFDEADTISYEIKTLEDKIGHKTKYLFCIDSDIVFDNIKELEQKGIAIYRDEYLELIELY